MRTMLSSMLAILILFPVLAVAQQADPFGGGNVPADPFAPNAANRSVQQAKKPKAIPAKVLESKAVPQRDPSDANERIRSVLSDSTSQEFIDTPLEEAIVRLSQSHDIPIMLDNRALEEVGLTTDMPVTISLKNVTLRSFLRLMLREFDLTYVVKSEVLLITTHEAAEQNKVLEMYTFPESLTSKSDEVVKVLTAAVSPESWATVGGASSASAIDNVLIISAPEYVHEGVIEFLQKLQKAYENHVAKQ